MLPVAFASWWFVYQGRPLQLTVLLTLTLTPAYMCLDMWGVLAVEAVQSTVRGGTLSNVQYQQVLPTTMI